MGWRWNDFNEAFGGSSKTNQWGGMAPNGDLGAEAQRQRAAGVYAPSNRGYQPNGLKPGDPGWYENRSKTYLWRDSGGGWDAFLKSMETGEDSAGAVQRLLTQFKGSREELADLMEVVGPMMGTLEARKLGSSDAMQYMSDQRNWDMGAMAGYGGAAAAVGQETRAAQQRAAQNLAASGLGRSSARASIQGMLGMQGAGQQANLMAQAQMAAGQNRMASAGNLLDAHRTMAQLALGQQLTPRINSPQGAGQGGVGWQQGALAGGAAGAALGPWGALIGAGIGAGIGAAGS